MNPELASAVQKSQSHIQRKNAVPSGTTDVVMARLFPDKRSKVPLDEARRQAVFAILNEVGAYETPKVQMEEQNGQASDEQGQQEHVADEQSEEAQVTDVR